MTTVIVVVIAALMWVVLTELRLRALERQAARFDSADPAVFSGHTEQAQNTEQV